MSGFRISSRITSLTTLYGDYYAYLGALTAVSLEWTFNFIGWDFIAYFLLLGVDIAY
jgi:hypothetical protein